MNLGRTAGQGAKQRRSNGVCVNSDITLNPIGVKDVVIETSDLVLVTHQRDKTFSLNAALKCVTRRDISIIEPHQTQYGAPEAIFSLNFFPLWV